MTVEPLSAHPAISAGATLPAVAAVASTCVQCPLAATRTQVVFGTGSQQAALPRNECGTMSESSGHASDSNSDGCVTQAVGDAADRPFPSWYSCACLIAWS